MEKPADKHLDRPNNEYLAIMVNNNEKNDKFMRDMVRVYILGLKAERHPRCGICIQCMRKRVKW